MSVSLITPGLTWGSRPGLAQDQRAHRGEIIDRRLVAEPVERAPRRLVFQLRLVAEREQRLLAAGVPARARDRQHFIRREISRG